MSSALLLVVANPYSAPTANGAPAGLCPKDPAISVAGGFVGATRTVISVEKVDKTKDLRTPRVETETIWDLTPVLVDDTPYYRKKVRKGELLAGDAETAAICGLVSFVPVDQALASAKRALEAEYFANHGKPAACAGDPVMTAPKPEPKPVAQATSPAAPTTSTPAITASSAEEKD